MLWFDKDLKICYTNGFCVILIHTTCGRKIHSIDTYMLSLSTVGKFIGLTKGNELCSVFVFSCIFFHWCLFACSATQVERCSVPIPNDGKEPKCEDEGSISSNDNFVCAPNKMSCVFRIFISYFSRWLIGVLLCFKLVLWFYLPIYLYLYRFLMESNTISTTKLLILDWNFEPISAHKLP